MAAAQGDPKTEPVAADTATPTPEVQSVFVISPIGEVGTPEHRNAQNVLEYIIRKALPPDRYEVVRADEVDSPDSISQQIVRRIVESDFVVADLSHRNANVFYELAVAHGFERPVVHLMVAGQSPPFDVADQRVIPYDLADPASVDSAQKSLARSIAHLDGRDELPRNPVTAFRNFAPIERSATPVEANEALAETLEQILLRLRRIEGQLAQSPPVPRVPEDVLRGATRREIEDFVRGRESTQSLIAKLGAVPVPPPTRSSSARMQTPRPEPSP